MTAASVPRIRARKPKVRTGCVTCKSRRIKCDEGRPICHRCQRSRLPCKYEPLEVSHGEREHQTRNILPASRPKPPKDGVGSWLLSGMRRSDLEGPEVLYFDLFRSTVVANLCLNGYTNLWSRTVLRESFRDECVRDCVLGIGALCRAMLDEGQQASSGPALLWTVPASALNPYRRDAILHYTRSISKFRSRIAREGSSTPYRSILIISILFIMFETMQGNTDSVDRIMHTTILALEGSMVSLRQDLEAEAQKSAAKLDDEGVREAEYFLTRLSGFCAFLSPFYPSLRKIHAYQSSCPLRGTVPDWSSSTKHIEKSFHKYTSSTVVWKFRKFQVCVSGRVADPVKHQEEQLVVSSQASEWSTFIKKKLKQEADALQCRSWRIMLVEATVFSLYVSYFQGVEEQERLWDARVADCRDAVALAESVLDGMSSEVPPLFEDKLLPSMRCITCKCRDYDVRTRALALCERLTGPWFENRAMLIGLKILIETEEQGRDADGFIPLSSRYRWDVSSWNHDRTEQQVVLTGVTTGLTKTSTVRYDDLIETATSSSTSNGSENSSPTVSTASTATTTSTTPTTS
ncbi:hypothetical protein AAE478_003430 [Parahypoxylon ruwenzoriense]